MNAWEKDIEGDFNYELEYDEVGRLKYHPEIHFASGIPLTEEECEYLCKFADADSLKTISMALGKTEMSIGIILNKFKKNGKYDYYRSLNNYI